MDTVQLLIENLGMILVMINQTLNGWVELEANATGPLDPSIELTPSGCSMVMELGNAAIGLSNMIAEAMDILF